jgi:hypothetical protein
MLGTTLIPEHFCINMAVTPHTLQELICKYNYFLLTLQLQNCVYYVTL